MKAQLSLAKMRALEKVFAAEIDDQLPFQSKAKIYSELTEAGLVEPCKRKFGTGWTAVICTGWALTWRGHITYSEWVAKQPIEEPK